MAEPFKNLLHAGLVQQAAQTLARHAPGFDAPAFVAEAGRGLDALALKARAMQMADALERHLPQPFGVAADAIEAALAPASADASTPQSAGPDRGAAGGLQGWILWPFGEFVARRGLAEPERALAALHAITQRFTAEFAIRPFIVEHPERVFETLARWTQDRSHHVRRLVSEGSRPRLPWGQQLRSLVDDPSPSLPLLLALQDDPSEYVRRSVANHLNDIAKDHPALLADWLHQHLPGASAERRALLRHASRTRIKAGDAAVLAAWGLSRPWRGDAAFAIAPASIRLGEAVTMTLSLRSTLDTAQRLVIDYAVHHIKADGRASPKVFKGWNLELAPRAAVTLSKRHAIRPITTRRYFAGTHRVSVHINGHKLVESHFELRLT